MVKVPRTHFFPYSLIPININTRYYVLADRCVKWLVAVTTGVHGR